MAEAGVSIARETTEHTYEIGTTHRCFSKVAQGMMTHAEVKAEVKRFTIER